MALSIGRLEVMLKGAHNPEEPPYRCFCKLRGSSLGLSL